MAADPAISKVDWDTPVRPGTKITFTLASPVAAETPVALFINKKPSILPPVKLAATKQEVTFTIDATALASITAAGKQEVAIGPPTGPPFPGGKELFFEPLPPPAVQGYRLRRPDMAGSEPICADGDPRANCRARLGDRIELYVSSELIAASKSADILMWIDGRPLPGVSGQLASNKDGISTLVFDWSRRMPAEKDAKEPWLRLMKDPWQQQTFLLSAGPAAGPPFPSFIRRFPMERLSWTYFLLWGLFFAVATGVLAYLIGAKGFLREPIAAGDTTTVPAFSLARVQLVAWTFLVAMALAYVWMCTWNEDVINNRILLLLGIAAGTTLAAVTIDNSKREQAARVVDNAPGQTTTAMNNAQEVLKTPPAESFLLDLISDRDGPSVSRVQMLLFTVILMVIFAVETARNVVMPEFSDTLLGLMGISSSGYLALKVPERKQ